MNDRRFDAFDTSNVQPSNWKSPDGRGQLTRLTDLTVDERGVYVTPARPRPPARPLGLLPAPSTTAVKSVKSVKSQHGGGVFSPPCRQTGCQFDGAGMGVHDVEDDSTPLRDGNKKRPSRFTRVVA